jgi:N-acetyl-anhydromuramyl-L-alanine amidase AmpD
MQTPLKIGSNGSDVIELQKMLNELGYSLSTDGIFGKGTQSAVIDFQQKKGLAADGIVGPRTMQSIKDAISEMNKSPFEQYLLSSGRMVKNANGSEKWVANYWINQNKPEWSFLHHTAGNADPYQTIDIWDKDQKTVATKFVIGGQSLAGDTKHDGKVLDCLPKGAWGAHLTIGATVVHRESIGIEICNYGGLTKGGYYSFEVTTNKMVWIPKKGDKLYNAYGTEMPDSQVFDLGEMYRFNRYFHRYTTAQIEATRSVLLYLKEAYGMNVTAGLKQLIQAKGVKAAFEYIPNYINANKGLYAHGNIFNGKNDIFPQKEMIEMIVSL